MNPHENRLVSQINLNTRQIGPHVDPDTVL